MLGHILTIANKNVKKGRVNRRKRISKREAEDYQSTRSTQDLA